MSTSSRHVIPERAGIPGRTVDRMPHAGSRQVRCDLPARRTAHGGQLAMPTGWTWMLSSYEPPSFSASAG
ncbi:hypothetical protein ACJ6WD_24970, partial [Streptomyces sp. VTCC 41912]|uniref:hypothetical protein n=1 Tax=Streptomyces sp. VTCC 41912 TaxID=3383243 RepID=UPI003896A5B5